MSVFDYVGAYVCVCLRFGHRFFFSLLLYSPGFYYYHDLYSDLLCFFLYYFLQAMTTVVTKEKHRFTHHAHPHCNSRHVCYFYDCYSI